MLRRSRLGASAALLALVSPTVASANSNSAQAAGRSPAKSGLIATTVRTSPIVDAAGLTWRPRTGFSGGHYWEGRSGNVKNTVDDELYRPELWGIRAWNRKVPNGDYRITLKMRESAFDRPGQRVFSVHAEGTEVIKDLDILKEVGRDTAYDRTFTVSVVDGSLDLTFSAKVNHAQVSAIKVEAGLKVTEPVPDPSPPQPETPRDTKSLDLPLIPWEGGNRYYAKFPDAVRAGWADERFFPIAVWWAVFDRDEDVKWDKSLGINTYVVTNPSNEQATRLLETNQMSWIGGQLPGMSRDSKSWVGDFLDDEVDGRFAPEDGLRFLQGLRDALPDYNKIRYTNYTSSIVNQWFDKSAAKRYVNDFTDVVSIDQYWHTVDFCNWQPYMGDYYYGIPIPKDICNTAASYGKTVDMLRAQDALDGELQPVWNFVENISGSPAEMSDPFLATPAQVKGAAMNSLIHEARGLIWFNNVFAGPCGTGNALRSAQRIPNFPCSPQIEAMGEVNNLVKSLAPVMNTQSYEWSFGPGLDTMLKVKDGHAYIFAMTDGGAGQRRLTLPAGIHGTTAEVIGEGRSLSLNAGSLVDTFATPSAYHVYRIKV